MAERYTKWRDVASGIHPLVPPATPVGQSAPLELLILPIRVVVGLLRVALLLVITLLWTVLDGSIGNFGRPIRTVIHAILGRAFLFAVGFLWLSSETVSVRSRGRANQGQFSPSFRPKAGDVILCNWSSWVDVLVLTIAFNPTFVRPVVQASPSSINGETTVSSPSSANNRRKGAAARGQQHAQMPRSNASASEATGTSPQQSSGEQRLLGWKVVGFGVMMLESGLCPPLGSGKGTKQLDEILKSASGPVVVFPELTTSNNRGLLRFESLLPHSWRSLYRATGAVRIGQGQSSIFIMSIKHDTPTWFRPSTTLSVPAAPLSPLPHILKLCFAPSTYSLGVRMLAEDESPTHAAFTADAGAAQRSTALSDKCADLMSSLARIRRTDLTWQDKEAFLAMYRKRA